MSELHTAEREVVGGFIRYKGEGLPSFLTPDYIEDAGLRLVLTAAMAVLARDRTVTPVLVGEHLKAAGLLGPDAVSGPLLVSLAAEVSPASYMPMYANRVVNAFNLRTLKASLEAGLCAVAKATEWEGALGAVKREVARAEGTLALGAKTDMVAVSTLVEDAVNKVLAIQAGQIPPALSTGWPSVDKLLSGGMRGGQFIVAAGRPAMGKSSFGTCLAANVARGGGHVLYYPFEESHEDVLHRWLSSDGKIPLGWLKDPGDARGNNKLLSTAAMAREWLGKVQVPQKVRAMTSGEVAASARRVHADTPVSMIVVDYIQRVKATNARDSRQLQVKYDCEVLHDIGVELNIPVVALAQVGRKCEERTDKRPLLSDLRESGDIENEAGLVLGLYRDEYYNPNTTDKGVVELLCLKQRFGPSDTVKLGWHGSTVTFSELEGQPWTQSNR